MTIDFIPLEYYSFIYYQILLVIVIVFFMYSQNFKIDSYTNRAYIKYLGFFLITFLIFYIGLRPIDRVFVDMPAYARMFFDHQGGYFYFDEYNKDIGFQYFIKLCTTIMNVQTFFFVCTLLYIIPLYYACKKWFEEYWFYAFLILITSLSFWGYGVNGIRNGISTSIFLFAISREKKIFQYLWLFISISFHFSILLPLIGFLITKFHNKPKSYLIFWALSIPASLLFSHFFELFFLNLGIEDERMSYFTDEVDIEKFSAIGFRWDFLLYSATGVLAGWYYIFKKKLNDKLYYQLYNTFLFANAFWILVIRSNFSNRFAYLSWFMMGLIIIYPWLKQKLSKKQYKIIGLIIFINFIFTYGISILL